MLCGGYITTARISPADGVVYSIRKLPFRGLIVRRPKHSYAPEVIIKRLSQICAVYPIITNPHWTFGAKLDSFMSWLVDIVLYEKQAVSVPTMAEKLYFELFTCFDDIFNPSLTTIVT